MSSCARRSDSDPSAPAGGREPLLKTSRQLAEILTNLSGMRVVLLGLGLFGGGEGAARFLAQKGAQVTVSDLKPAEHFAPVIERLSDLPIQYQLGGHDLERVLKADLVVVNPAVPRTSSVVRACREAAIPLTSPMNMFVTLCPAPAAAVTGAVGKSTTTAMLGAMLSEGHQGNVWVGGNIGVSLLPVVDKISAADLVVLEMSSFQLEDTACLPWSPHVAIITNITPNHLDRYETFEAYVEAKKSIIAFQSETDAAVFNASDATLRLWAYREAKGKVLFFDPAAQDGPMVEGVNLRGGRLIWNSGGEPQVICAREHISVPGAHNLANAMAAVAAARWLQVDVEPIRRALANFKALEHRLEKCGESRGITFYNDSDSTTPESTVAALKSFDGPVTLIAGGYDKKLDLRPLAQMAAQRAKVLITIGQTGPMIAQWCGEAALQAGKTPVIREAGSLEEAVQAALELSMPGSAVVFSPGCASYDMFRNFDDRGHHFKKLVAAAT